MFHVQQTYKIVSSDIVIIPVFQEKELISSEIQKKFSGLESVFCSIKKNEDFEGKYGEVAYYHTAIPKYPRVLFVGMGKREETNNEIFRRIGGIVRKKCVAFKVADASFVLFDTMCKDAAIPLLQGFLLASYAYDRYRNRTKKHTKAFKSLYFITLHAPTQEEKNKIRETLHVIEGVFIARNLVNTPANDLTPQIFAKETQRFKKMKRMKVTVIDEKKLKKLGAGAILGVGQGSKHPPLFVILEYRSKKKNAKTIGLVGKGITFDSGGIHLKPVGHIETMKMDMSGAASVFGLFHILSKEELPVNIVAVMVIAENAIGPSSIRPGDVIKSYDGQTIEVTNTDAEGRLVVADALSYLQDRYKNLDAIVDIATLTGGCIVALGYDITGLLTNSEDLHRQLQAASEKTGEKIWQLPLDKDLLKTVKGEFTDLQNFTRNVKAMAIMGGAFLHAFIKNNIKWAHLDIAGTAWAETNQEYKSRGATGCPVRLMWEFLKVYR